MTLSRLPEVWLRGPLNDIAPLLQPVAHCLMQAREEIQTLLADAPSSILWQRPAGLASPGFHLLHLTGVLDRLFTYARGEKLTEGQLAYLASEAEEKGSIPQLVVAFNQQVEKALQQLKTTDENMLTELRTVGRAALPSTVLGLLVHAAEHTMRHVGQLLVTIKILTQQQNK